MTDERDKLPTDPIAPVGESRTRTAKTSASIVIDFADGDQLAEFLDFVSDLIRKRRTVKLTVE